MSRTLQFYDYVGADDIADKEDSDKDSDKASDKDSRYFSVIRDMLSKKMDMLSKKMDESDSSDDEKFQNFAPGSVDEDEDYNFKITCSIM